MSFWHKQGKPPPPKHTIYGDGNPCECCGDPDQEVSDWVRYRCGGERASIIARFNHTKHLWETPEDFIVSHDAVWRADHRLEQKHD